MTTGQGISLAIQQNIMRNPFIVLISFPFLFGSTLGLWLFILLLLAI